MGIWVGAVIGLIGGGIAFATLSAAKIGEACERDDDCRSGMCVRVKGNAMNGYCSKSCEGEACPPAWACAEIRVDTYDLKKASAGPNVSHTKACLRAR